MQGSFSDTDCDRIRRYLGYPPSSPWAVLPRFDGEYPQDTIDRALEIMQEIEEINELMRKARQESMGVEMDDLKLDYAQHVRHLRSDRMTLMEELSGVMDQPLYSASLTSSTVKHYQ